MSKVKIVGRTIDFDSKHPGRPDIKKKEQLTLAEASTPTSLLIHKLKEAIREKRLDAE
jgi:hypothetical protein